MTRNTIATPAPVTAADSAAPAMSRGGSITRGLPWRLFLTVWLVYAIHATTNVVRETYLAIALGNSASVRVDEYLGLHPDLFEIPGRGAYINNNPGASMLGAIPYALIVRPAIAVAVWMRPEIAAPKPPAAYDDPRPNRTRFLNEARARGLDIVLGLSAIGIQVTLMAPLAALATLLMLRLLRARLGDERQALLFSLLYAFATPILFRSAFLNQNVIIAHLLLGAFIAFRGWTPRPNDSAPSDRALLAVGLLLGIALVCDYSAVPLLLVFGLWIVAEAWRYRGLAPAIREGALCVAGAIGPTLVLLGYQWVAFGHPLFPAQRYMPATEYSVRGWFGMSLPAVDLLWRNLADPRYGLFAFCPLLVAAVAAPFVRRTAGRAVAPEGVWILALAAGLWLFNSANQFAALQWNTGVRYMVPVVPLLFLMAIPVLRAMSPWLRWLLLGSSVMISWAVTMTRESVPTALSMVARDGVMLPITVVLEKVASGYPALAPGPLTPLLIYLALAVVLRWIWRRSAAERLTASRQAALK